MLNKCLTFCWVFVSAVRTIEIKRKRKRNERNYTLELFLINSHTCDLIKCKKKTDENK